MGDDNNNLNNNPHLRREVQMGQGLTAEESVRMFDDWLFSSIDTTRGQNRAWLEGMRPGILEGRNLPALEVTGTPIALGIPVAPEWALLTPAQRGYGGRNPPEVIVERPRNSTRIAVAQPYVDPIRELELQYLEDMRRQERAWSPPRSRAMDLYNEYSSMPPAQYHPPTHIRQRIEGGVLTPYAGVPTSIDTFDDLHFQYMADQARQGRIDPRRPGWYRAALEARNVRQRGEGGAVIGRRID